MPTYANATDFQLQKMNNVKTKDFGGLEVLPKENIIDPVRADKRWLVSTVAITLNPRNCATMPASQ